MKPVELEIIMRDSTRQGMQSVEGNINAMETQMQDVIGILKKELAGLQDAFKNALSHGVSNSSDLADIQALKGKIGELEAQVRSLTDTLGRYDAVKKESNATPFMQNDPMPKLNNVKMSMQQIARELPALSMGPQMFFMAISNNIPMFTDAVGDARKEYERLTAAGQKATPVWKQLLTSLFSWQTMMAAAITLTVVYGKEIGEWFSSFSKGKKGIDVATESLKGFHKAMTDGEKNAQKDLTRLNLLYNAAINSAKGTDERKRAVLELKKEYPDYFGKLDEEAILLGNAKTAYDKLSASILATAKARAAEEAIGENSKKVLDLDDQRIGSLVRQTQAQGRLDKEETLLNNLKGNPEGYDFQLEIVDAARKKVKEYSDQVDATVRQIELLNKTNERLAGKISIEDLLDDDPDKKPVGKTPDNYQDKLSDARIRAKKKLEAALVQIEQEGYEKRRRQKELEYNDELDNISKREQKLVKVLDNTKKNGNPVTSEDYKQVHNDAGDERSAALMIYKNELEKINKEASSAEREKLEEYAKQFQGYITKRTSTEKGFDTKRGALREDGASDETLAELDYQKNKALEEIDYEFASRETAFQTWAGNVVNLSLEELQRLLVEAEKELEREDFLHPNDTGLASKRAKVKTLQGALTDKTNNPKKGKEDDPKRSMKEWAELNSVLGDVEDSFSDIGGTVGDVAGDIIKTAGTIATSTLRIIDGITTLSENAAKGIEGTSDVAAKSLSAVEKASVILAIISAAMKAVTAIASLFKRTDYMEEFRKEMAKLNYELELTKLNAEISTDKKNIFGDDLWGNAVKNVTLAHEALNRYNNTLDKIAGRKKYTGFLGAMAEAQGLKNTYDSLGDSIANMQLKIRHKTWFRSAKYSSLKDAVPELFNADGSVNQSSLEKFIGSDTFGKLSQENQQYLQEMSDYWKAYQETVEQVKDYLSDIFGDLGGTLTDTLVDAWVNGTDAAESYCNSVSDMLEQLGKQMIYSAVFSDIFEKAQQKMLDVTQDTDLSADQKFQEYIKLLGGMTDEVMDKQDDFNALLEAYQKMAADKGFDLFKPEEESSSQSGRAGAITTVTEETAGKLEGIGHSIQTHIISMDDKLTDISQAAYEAIGVLGKIAENTAYCKYLEQLADDSAYQRREGTKLR